MSTADLAQLSALFSTVISALAGVFAFVASRVKRTQREQADEIKALRRYAVEVARWGFQVQFLSAGRGLDMPVMPRPPWESEDEDEEDEPAPARSRHALRGDPDSSDAAG